jgi:transcriptional regulator with XRE-family HTH domain
MLKQEYQMSNLANEMSRQIELGKLTQVTVAERSEIDQTQISEWLNARRSTITPKQLAQLAPALSDEPRDNALLYAAHLKDELIGPNRDLVEISIKSIGELKDKAVRTTAIEDALCWITAEVGRNRTMRQWLIAFHKLMGCPKP